MEDVEQFLSSIHLGQYANAFEESGYDSLGILFVMDDLDFEIFGKYVGVLPGHLTRLKKAINVARKKAQHSMVDLNDLDGHDAVNLGGSNSCTNSCTGDDTAVAAATAASAEGSRPSKRKREGPNGLPKVCWNSKDVRVVSLRHSTQLGASAMRDNKSGGKRIIFRCRSVLSKRVKKAMGPGATSECKHCLIWNKRKDGFFHLNPESILEHAPMCVSSQRVSRCELVHDPQFVRHCFSETNVTGSNSAKNALGVDGRMDGSINSRTAKRASNDVKRFHDKDYEEDWSKLRQWGAEYERKNQRSRFQLKINEDTGRSVFGPWAQTSPFNCWALICYHLFVPSHVNRFERVFISIGNSIDIAYGCGLKFCAVDAAFSKHTIYRDGYLHLLTTRDGNNELLILAVAVCETESGPTYEWFADQCKQAGLERYLNGKCVIFSDRQKGLEKFHEAFAAKVGRCFQHIIKNARKHIKGSGQTFEDQAAWLIQKAKTEVDYQHFLGLLRLQSPMAAEYFASIEHPEQVYQYLLNELGVATHGHKTSNIVECGNGVFVPARHYTPYYMLNKILGWQGHKFYERAHALEAWVKQGHFLTKYAYNLFQVQLEIAKRTGYEVTPAGNQVFYVQDKNRADAQQYEVDLNHPECCCYLSEHLQPCRHLICVFAKEKMLGPNQRTARATMTKYWPKWAQASLVCELYANRGVRKPSLYSGKFTGPDEERILPPLQSAVKRGRPKKKRYRYKAKTVDDVKARLTTIYHPDYAALLAFC